MNFLSAIKTLIGHRILIYADFIDPFCYAGFHVLWPLAQSHGVELEWRGFELNPDTPAEGLTLMTAGNSDLRPGMWASVQSLTRSAGLDFPEPRRVPNTRGAHALVGLASGRDVKNPLIERIYQAYFNRQEDIGCSEVLIDLAGEFRIPAESVRTALADRRLPGMLEARRSEAQRHGFLGLPGFVYKRKNHFGALSKAAWENIFA
jgi:predicted DsbA family dithiol-disulfide isomerase